MEGQPRLGGGCVDFDDVFGPGTCSTWLMLDTFADNTPASPSLEAPVINNRVNSNGERLTGPARPGPGTPLCDR
jgi:hypothetical protein